jgi:hypothetical protein
MGSRMIIRIAINPYLYDLEKPGKLGVPNNIAQHGNKSV